MSIAPVGAGGMGWSQDGTRLRSGAVVSTANLEGEAEAHVNALAGGFGTSLAAIRSFLSGGGSLSVSSTPQGLEGLPIGPDGAPDFDRIVAEGGTVKGAIPPEGYPKFTMVSQLGNTTWYAAEITLGDGSPPRFVKGGDNRSESSNGSAANLQMALQTLKYFNKLPNSLAEFLQRSNENFFDTRGASHLDAAL
jgi:hypothetical protein